MARPNVTVIINDESFVISGAEEGGTHRSGFITPSDNDLISYLGSTAERDNGIMIIENMDDWLGRLKSTAPIGSVGDSPETMPEDASALPFFNPLGVNAAEGSNTVTVGNDFAGATLSRWPDGPTGSWKAQWWAVHNYLTYGGVCVVARDGSGLTASSVELDSMFAKDESQNAAVIINAGIRGDCIAVLGISSEKSMTEASAAVVADQNHIYVYGEKVHRDWRRLNASVDPTSDETVTTSLAADVAGCLARTDRLTSPWFSPAGIRRGQILDVIKLARELGPIEQDLLYDAKINPVASFPGEGTILFGDKTSAASTSTLSRINVARLFIYLQKVLGTAARNILFEQNDSTTRQQFVNSVVPFLDSIVGQRGITEYRVICDETNNTSDIVDSNQFVADVFVKPTKSVNFIRLRFTNVSEGTPLS